MPEFDSESTPNSPRWWQAEIASVIRREQAESGLGSLWREPLVGVAAATDPLFQHLREVVDPGFRASDLEMSDATALFPLGW